MTNDTELGGKDSDDLVTLTRLFKPVKRIRLYTMSVVSLSGASITSRTLICACTYSPFVDKRLAVAVGIGSVPDHAAALKSSI